MGRRRNRRARHEEADGGLPELAVDLLFLIARLLVRGVGAIFKALFSTRTRRQAAPAVVASAAVAPMPPPMPQQGGCEALPYQRAESMLTKGEKALREPLHIAVKGKYLILCKVRLADVIRCPQHRMDEARWFKKISRYHLDFVLCDIKTTAPLLAIELDDRGHANASRKEMDNFKDSALRSASMPILRIPCQQAYDPIELTSLIERNILRVGKR